jgi:hypothetical protein
VFRNVKAFKAFNFNLRKPKLLEELPPYKPLLMNVMEYNEVEGSR